MTPLPILIVAALLAARGEGPVAPQARDFSSDQGAGPKEYREYFEAQQRRAGGKDPLPAQPDFHHGLQGREESLSRLTKEGRRALVQALTAFPLNVRDGRGYNFAEVTSGGVPLQEVNPKTMESRVARGLHFVGEILDVDGRIGGFNFQWAWATAKVAGRALSSAKA